LTEALRRLGREIGRELRGLGAEERLAVIGAAGIGLSLLLPWYGVPVAGDLVQTGIGAFTFAEGAIVAVCAATVFLAMRVGGGYELPRPLKEWALFCLAGAWIALILAYRMLERPEVNFDLEIIVVERTYSLRYGIFVALAGAALIFIAGLRGRARERASRS
jgi:hypothetical protein